jgi:hypothetical protein
MPNTFLDELARLNAQNFLGGLTKIGEAVKEMKQNEAINNQYNIFRIKSDELKTTERQLADLNTGKPKPYWQGQSDFTEPDAITKFAEKSAQATANLNKILNMSESYSELYQPFILSFATLGEEGVQIANSLSHQLEDKKQLLDKRGKLSLMQVEEEFNKMQYAKAVQENLMNDFKFDVLKKEYQTNESASQVEGIIRSLPEYNNLPDMATVHSSQRLAVFNKLKKEVIAKAIQVAQERNIRLNEQIVGIAFQKTLTEDKKLILAELKPSDYPINQEAQGQADYKNTYDMYSRFMETATHMYSNVYNNAPEDEKSLLIRGALDKLKNNKGYVQASLAPSKLKSEEMNKNEYDALFNSQDGFYTIFGPGGLYDQAQNWMGSNVMGWNTMTKKEGFDLPSVPGTENIMRYKGSGAAINFDGAWVHNPAEIKRRRVQSEILKNKSVREKQGKSVIQRGEGGTLRMKGNIQPVYPYSWMVQ